MQLRCQSFDTKRWRTASWHGRLQRDALPALAPPADPTSLCCETGCRSRCSRVVVTDLVIRVTSSLSQVCRANRLHKLAHQPNLDCKELGIEAQSAGLSEGLLRLTRGVLFQLLINDQQLESIYLNVCIPYQSKNLGYITLMLIISNSVVFFTRPAVFRVQ